MNSQRLAAEGKPVVYPDDPEQRRRVADELEKILRMERYRKTLEEIARTRPDDPLVQDLLKKPTTGY